MMTYLLIAFAVLQVLDLYTTSAALKSKTAKEANGLMRPLFDKFGLVPTMVIKGIVLTIIASLVEQPYLIGMCLIYIFVVINNFRVIYGR